MAEFRIGETDFLLDGEPFRILSGALHYFRVHPDLWADRIDKARRMGLNTIETYVPWNAHEPVPGKFDASGQLDLDRFLRLIGEAGMSAIVRPGPYICAEWDNGGLPAWLTRDPEIGLRRNEPRFLAAVGGYLRQVLGIVAGHQIDRGGPVLLVQIENEYGAYGNDKAYLEALVEFTREAGITVPLTTVDQPTSWMLEAGRLDGLHMTASFGARAAERLEILRRHQPTGPLMCMEFWNGWFDDWGAHHHTTPVDEAAAELDTLLAAGASVNLYLVHGGTNFGLTNGANHKGTYQPLVTSYDYDAPIDEAGNPTPKYHAFREVIARYAPVPGSPPPRPAPAPEFTVALREPVRLLADPTRWGDWHHHHEPPAFDALDPIPRMALLRTRLAEPGLLTFGEVRDRAAVFLDGRPAGVLLRDHHEHAIELTTPGELTLFVEDLGRVNYGSLIGERKGIVGGVRLNGESVTGWDVLPLDLTGAPSVWEDGPAAEDTAGPVVRRGEFALPDPADLHLDTAGWGKGVVWLNGFCLGRYWQRGPQRTLYVPAPVVRSGRNELVVFETAVMTNPVASFVPEPILGHTEP